MIAVLAICAAAWWRLSGPKPSPALAPPDRIADTVPPAAAVGPPPATVASLPPLPPRDARVQDVLPDLQARADAGDGIAACRLSIELMRCQVHARKFPDRLSRLERDLARLRGKQDRRAVAAIAEVEAELARALETDATCARLPEGLADRGQYYLRAAALAGEPASRFRYASGAGFEDAGGFEYLVTPAFDQWRREAQALMQQSLDEGRPEASLVLAFAYANDLGLFAGVVPDDPASARAHLALAKHVYGDSLAAFPFPLPQAAETADAAETARADALAAQWHQAHFGGRQYDFMDLLEQESSAWGDDPAVGAALDPCPGAQASDHG